MITKKRCCVTDCTRDAAYDVRLSLAVNAEHEPAMSSPLIQVCEKHKSKFTFKDFSGDKQWAQLCAVFVANGYAAPKQEFSKIVLTPVDNTNFKMN